MGQTSNRIDILYVGHDPAVVKMVTGSLDGTFDQISVETAASAGSGFDRLAKRDTDCLLLETTLPDRDKREFLDPVQAEYPDLPVLLLTEGADDRLESDALANGTDSNDYIHKEVATTDPELLANRIQTLVERVREQRRARALTRIWGLVSDVNQALRRASSRTAAEQRICDLLSQSDPYQFAWIGDVDPDTDRIVPRAAAGMDETYLDEVTVTVDESPTGQGPGGTAIRESAIAVSQDVRNDPAFDPWREAAMEHGYRSVAAIPLEYDDTLYGLLAVYADRTHAFDDDEQAVLADLGDDIAHAFHSFAIETQHHQERIQRETLFENAPVPVAQGSISPDGAHYRISAINSTFESIFGYDAAAVIGQDVADVIVPSDRRDKHNGLRERVASGEPIIAEVQRSTVDDQREFLLHVVPYGTAETPADGWFAWYTDVTDQKERQRDLEETAERMRLALQGSNSWLWELDVETNLTTQIAVTGLLGVDGTEVTRPMDEFLDQVHPDDCDKLLTADLEAMDGDRYHAEYRLLTDDGVRWIESHGRLYTDDGERSDRVIGIARDITAHKERERELEAQNERLEQLTSVVSHDLRNPLQVAQGRLEVARGECDCPHLDAVANAQDRMEQLIDELLMLDDFGQRPLDVEIIDLEPILETCWRTVHTREATLFVETDRTIRADRTRLQQLLENLIRNAIEHGGGAVNITVGDLPEGFYVADDGPGIPPAQREQVFEMGYSITEGGSGLGLAIVDEIVDAHDWTVTSTESQAGGARFEFSGVDIVEM